MAFHLSALIILDRSIVLEPNKPLECIRPNEDMLQW
nr:MAG TPA: hypothetical protein [Caudoviricetes sp.]